MGDKSIFFKFLIFSLILFLGINFFIFYNKNKKEINLKKTEVLNLEKEIADLRRKNEILKREIYFLNTDQGIESAAREKLGLAKPKEIIFLLHNKKKAPLFPKKAEVKNNFENENKTGWLNKLKSFFKFSR